MRQITYVHCGKIKYSNKIKSVRRYSAHTEQSHMSLQVDSSTVLHSTRPTTVSRDVQLVSRPGPTTHSRSQVNAHVVQTDASKFHSIRRTKTRDRDILAVGMIMSSVFCLSMMLCIVAKWYILQQKCLKRWIGSDSPRNIILQLSTPYTNPILLDSPPLEPYKLLLSGK